ncbi:MAG TPA: hypothetical protein VLK32_09055 [Bacillota bacterium]|nr:hypothetical protein [Bacillota bacterium]
MAIDRQLVIQALTEYVRHLEQGAANTTRAELRPQYRDRLAQAARLFAALSDPRPDWEKVRTIVTDEERAIGWSYLPGGNGAEAESAFVRVRKLVRED